jgi:murein DD-endopeptidase MepM/ murein hydrolase activator NlpD
MKRNKLVVVIAVILAALMILPIVIGGIAELFPKAQGSGGAPTQKSISDKKKEIETLKTNRAKIQGQLKELKTLRADIVQIKTLYDEQIMSLEEDIALTIELIAEIGLASAEQQIALDQARTREAELSELFISRFQAMESMGDISYLGLLLRADSLAGFLTQWDAVQEIMKRDRKLADDLVAARLEIEETIARLEQDRQEQVVRQRELTLSQVELAQLSAETDAEMAKYIAEMAKAEKEEKDLADRIAKEQKEADEMEALWKKLEEERKKRNNPYIGGEYHFPLPGYKPGSGFGMRLHPIYKVNRMHYGLDIGAPKGTPVQAANGGIIAAKAYGSGYGNYVVIDHGGGQTSLYAHLSSFAKLNVGDSVTRAQVIGYVGSTGVSTGPHLHLEIRINGVAVDPEKLLRG